MVFAIVQGEMGDSDETARTTACVITGSTAYAKCFGSFLSLKKTYILKQVVDKNFLHFHPKSISPTKSQKGKISLSLDRWFVVRG